MQKKQQESGFTIHVSPFQIGFFYSACGGGWSPTLDSLTAQDATALVVREKLCCDADPDRDGAYK